MIADNVADARLRETPTLEPEMDTKEARRIAAAADEYKTAQQAERRKYTKLVRAIQAGREADPPISLRAIAELTGFSFQRVDQIARGVDIARSDP